MRILRMSGVPPRSFVPRVLFAPLCLAAAGGGYAAYWLMYNLYGLSRVSAVCGAAGGAYLFLAAAPQWLRLIGEAKAGRAAGKCALFLLLAAIGYSGLQAVFVPKWNYPYWPENNSLCIRGLYAQEPDSVDVVFLGSSHMLFGIDCMKLYEENAIAAYNCATSGQSIETSYYYLTEALRLQRPGLVVLDAARLFQEQYHDASTRKVLDTIPFSQNKLEFALWYAKKHSNPGRSFLGALFPLNQYHARWNELKSGDFALNRNRDHYAKGSYMHSRIIPAEQTPESMNEAARILLQSEAYEINYANGRGEKTEYENVRYAPVISDENREWLNRISRLCREHGCELLLVKIPIITAPQIYSGAWTRQMSEAVARVSEECGLRFVDLLYDRDVGLDTDRDYCDNGEHLNFRGMEKATGALAPILPEYLDESAAVPRAMYDAALPMYRKVRQAATLETETDFLTYLELLRENTDDYVIAIAARDDMRGALTREESNALNALGLAAGFQTDLNVQDSYLAVIDGGEVLLEALSNRRLERSLTTGGGQRIQLVSSGWFNAPLSSVKIGGREHSLNRKGVNLVVLDRESGLVIDSVTFDTGAEGEHAAQREPEQTLHYLRQYESALIERANARGG